MNMNNSTNDRKQRLQGIIDLHTQTTYKNRILAKRLNKHNIYVEMLQNKISNLKAIQVEQKRIHEIESQTELLLNETNDLANDAEIIRLQQQIKQKVRQIAKCDNELNENVKSICCESDHRLICKKMIELIFTKHCTGLIFDTVKADSNSVNKGFVRTKDFELEEITLNNTKESQVNEYWNYVSKSSNHLNEWNELFFDKKPLPNNME